MLSPFGKTLYDATNFYRDYLEKASSSITVSKLCGIVGAEFEKRFSNGGARFDIKGRWIRALKSSKPALDLLGLRL
jgi:hypothetical protein